MSRVQGGLLADGVNSLLAGLMTTSPNTTFSQNNGVIVITGCASRAADPGHGPKPDADGLRSDLPRVARRGIRAVSEARPFYSASDP